jgi:hypothetical protein
VVPESEEEEVLKVLGRMLNSSPFFSISLPLRPSLLLSLLLSLPLLAGAARLSSSSGLYLRRPGRGQG